MVVCGDCGSPMHGCTSRSRHTALNGTTKHHAYKRYICGKYNSFGKTEKGCKFCNTVLETELTDIVASKLADDFLSPGNLAALKAEMRKQAAETETVDPI